MREFGSAVRRRREELGLTQLALAERTDLHATYVSGIERGLRNVSLVNIHVLAAGLEIKPADLIS